MASGSAKNSTKSFEMDRTTSLLNLSKSELTSSSIDIFLNHANSYHGRSIVQEILNASRNNKFLIHGTLENLSDIDVDPLDVSLIKVLDKNEPNFINQVVACNFIVYDINKNPSQIDEACKVLKKLKETFEINAADSEKAQQKKSFVLISTILTWFMTTPIDENGTEILLTENHYRKRRAHPCYNAHLALEREVMNFQSRYNHVIETVVICPGVTYGGAEETFHYLFKMAYSNFEDIKIYEPGNNVIPMIHIDDFARIIFSIVKHFPDPKIRYILAAQPNLVQYVQFAEAVVKNVGENYSRIKICSKEEMFAIDSKLMSQEFYLKSTVNLKMRSTYFDESYFQWIGDDLPELGKRMAKEYYKTRKLGPIKVIIHGPPLSGKSKLAEKLSEYYGAPTIDPAGMLENMKKHLETRIQNAEAYLEYVSNSNLMPLDESDEVITFQMLENVAMNIAKWRKDVELIESDLTDKEEVIAKLLVELLGSARHSQNHGYILDGFPFKRNVAEQVFLLQSGNGDKLNEQIKPDVVIVLNAAEEFLCNSARDLQELEAVRTKNTEIEFLKKLEDYREISYEDCSLLNFLLDHDMLPLEFNIDETSAEEIFEKVKSIIGKPRKYPLSKEETETRQIIAEQIKFQKAKENAEKVKFELENMMKMRDEQIKAWVDQKIQLKREQIEMLGVHSMPVRKYLMKHILPSITDALVEVVKMKPNDPIDFLAEQLLKMHPIGNQMLQVTLHEEIIKVDLGSVIDVVKAGLTAESLNSSE